MSLVKSRSATACRVLALLVFLAGIAILLVVFDTAWHLFSAPVRDLPLPVKPNATPPPAANIGIALAAFARQLLWLGLMTIVGSLIAEKGIRLYFSAPGATAEPSAPSSSPRNGHAAAPAGMRVPEPQTQEPPVS